MPSTLLHDIDPTALSLWPVQIHWYGVMYLLGFLAAWWLGRRRIRAGRLPGVTEQGFGKRTDVADFPIKHRATGGVIANSLNKETGDVAAIRLVGRDDEELMLITELGTILRTEVGGINRYRRASRGVTVMKPQDEDRIVSITVFVDDRLPEEQAEAE